MYQRPLILTGAQATSLKAVENLRLDWLAYALDRALAEVRHQAVDRELDIDEQAVTIEVRVQAWAQEKS